MRPLSAGKNLLFTAKNESAVLFVLKKNKFVRCEKLAVLGGYNNRDMNC